MDSEKGIWRDWHPGSTTYQSSVIGPNASALSASGSSSVIGYDNTYFLDLFARTQNLT